MRPMSDISNRIRSVVHLALLMAFLSSINAAPVYIKNFSSFPAYPYNTSGYKQSNAFVGCGPTTGAMMMGYFDHVKGLPAPNGLLTNPGTGVNEGLNTAWVLHNSTYMKTQATGFGSVYDIKPGLENYGASRGYTLKVMIHVSPLYNNPSSPDAATLNNYGAYGEAWTNDGIFWVKNADNSWTIDAGKFCDFVDPKLAAGIPIFLTIDTDMDKSGDHWVALVGYDRVTSKYYYYDTYSTTLQNADIHYCAAPGPAVDNAISYLRTVTYIGPNQPLNPPRDLLALTGYHNAVPLAWNAPTGTVQLRSQIIKYEETYGEVASVPLKLFKTPVESSGSLFDGFADFPASINVEAPLIQESAALTGYTIYRSTTSGGVFTVLAANITHRYYRDESAINGQIYYYKVNAVYSNGESDFTSVVNATPVANGYVINSAWTTTTPTIDGVLNTAEWTSAQTVNLLYPGATGTVTLYVMNSSTKLYMAVDDKRDTHLDHQDQFAIFFDKNMNREWPAENTPADEGNFWWAWNGSTNSAFNLFGPRQGYWPDHLIWPVRVTASGMEQAISVASGNVKYEGSIDLAASPLQVAAGGEFGFLAFTYDKTPSMFTGFWPQQAERLKVVTPDIQYWGQAPFSFGNLNLAKAPVNVPNITVTPTAWDYGPVPVNLYADKSFVIRNTGRATLNITGVTLVGDPLQFSMQGRLMPFSLLPGESREIEVRFKPTTIGAKNIIVRIASNDPDQNPFNVSLKGLGILPPKLAITPAQLDFGTSLTQLNMQINNQGEAPLTWKITRILAKPWITSISPDGGADHAEVKVTVDRTKLVGNSDTDTLLVASNDGTQKIKVTVARPAASLPSNWAFSGNTGNNASIVLPTLINPTADGAPLQNGDYIGLFTPAGLCCGWKQWQGVNMSLTAWGDNDQTPAIDGFRTAEKIAYRVFRISSPKEWTFVETGYSAGNGEYAANALMVLNKFAASSDVCLTIDFKSGWNMFSLNVKPLNLNVADVMNPVTAKLVMVKSGDGKTYVPQYTINDIGDLQVTQGYQAYLNQAATLSICGTPFTATTSMALPAGWSIISYLPRVPMDAATALAGISTNLVIAKDNSGQTYVPKYGIQDIGAMQPGQGYLVYLSSAGTLTYPAAAGLQKQDNQLVDPSHFVQHNATGENATIIVPVSINPHYPDGSDIQPGDEIGVFTSAGQCCGVVVWDGLNKALTVWGDDNQTPAVDGAVPGETLWFRLWRKLTNNEFPATGHQQSGTTIVYSANSFLVLSELMVLNPAGVQGTGQEIPNAFVLFPNYPNPFNPQTQIAYDLPENANLRLCIFDIQGRLVRELVHADQPAGHYTVTWDGQDMNGSTIPSGIYIYQLMSAKNCLTRRLILLK